MILEAIVDGVNSPERSLDISTGTPPIPVVSMDWFTSMRPADAAAAAAEVGACKPEGSEMECAAGTDCASESVKTGTVDLAPVA